jgi:hypothetical protein
MQTFEFGSVSGSTFAFYCFLLLTAGIGWAVYHLLIHASARRWQFRTFGEARRLPAAGFGALLTAVLFATVYFSMLDGFYRMEVGGNELRLGYILPKRTLVLRRAEVSESVRRPSYKGRWVLVLYEKHGQNFESTPAGYVEVLKAWQHLNAYLQAPKS